MADQSEARTAIYDAVVKTAEASVEWGGPGGAQMLRDAAIAFRAAAGGAQVGGVFIDGNK